MDARTRPKSRVRYAGLFRRPGRAREFDSAHFTPDPAIEVVINCPNLDVRNAVHRRVLRILPPLR